ncbi:MAG TPA: VWA domain-containing protein [Gaiellaceae bacterium]
MSTRRLPVADAALLRPATTRSRRLRAALTVASLLLLGAAVLLAARSPGPAVAGAARGGASTEIVLDVSGSVDSSSRAAGAALTRLARAGGRAGLILFSDTAQETLPPTTPAAQLLPFARSFAPAKRSTAGPYRLPQLDSNPWRPSFSGGTRISAGLAAARAALRRDRVHGSVLLISDLGNPVTDAGATKRQLIALDRAGIGVKILPLPNALSADLRWFRRLEGPARFERPLPVRPPRRPATEAVGFPLALAGAAALLALVLGADQLAGRSLRWGAIR